MCCAAWQAVWEWGISGFLLQGNGSGTGHKGWRDVGVEHTWKHHPGREDEDEKVRRDKMNVVRIEETR